MIGAREECLATIDRYLKVGVTHFIFTLPRPFYRGRSSALCRRGDSRGAIALTRSDHYAVGGVRVGGIERRRDSRKCI